MNKHLNDKIDGIDRAISTLPDVEQAEVLPQLAQTLDITLVFTALAYSQSQPIYNSAENGA